MSLNLSRRDAVKGMMAAGAAVAAMPYLAGLAGSASAGPARGTPIAPQAQSAKVSSASGGFAGAIPNDAETVVLVIKNDAVSVFKGFQKIRFQDAQLASTLKAAVKGRFD